MALRVVMMAKKVLSPFSVAVTGIFTAFVCVATIIVSAYIPATRGFFNIGESLVFVTALLFGPAIGAFAGGVGSSLADLLLGFWYYAPATLVIKACEGYVVGTLKNFNPQFKSSIHWKFFTTLLAVVAGVLLAYVGSVYYSGQTYLTLGFTVFSIFIPWEIWLTLGVLVACFVSAIGFFADPEFGWSVLSVVTGGFVMVAGYFIYEFFFIGWLFNIQAAALAEIPFNIGQMIVGAAIAMPVTKAIHRVFPYLRRNRI